MFKVLRGSFSFSPLTSGEFESWVPLSGCLVGNIDIADIILYWSVAYIVSNYFNRVSRLVTAAFESEVYTQPKKNLSEDSTLASLGLLFFLTVLNIVKQLYAGIKISRLLMVFFRDGSAFFAL